MIRRAGVVAIALLLAACGSGSESGLAISTGNPTGTSSPTEAGSPTDAGGNSLPTTPVTSSGTSHSTNLPSPTKNPHPSCGSAPGGTTGGKTPQKINFDQVQPVYWPHHEATLKACSSSGLPVSFRVLEQGGDYFYCSVAGLALKAKRVVKGCTVEASQAGDARFAPAEPVLRTFTVNLQIIKVSWSVGPPDSVTAGENVDLVAKATSPSGSLNGVSAFIALEPSANDVCSRPLAGVPVANGKVSFQVSTAATGTCTVNVIISGDQSTNGDDAGKATFEVTAAAVSPAPAPSP